MVLQILRVFALLAVLGFMVELDPAWAQKRFARTKNPRSIGNGLCTPENRDKVQAVFGYCRTLHDLLTREDSCSRKVLDEIALLASGRAGGIGGMKNFCSSYSELSHDPGYRAEVFQNILAALITEESHWRPHVTGDKGLSKGLFMISIPSVHLPQYSCACKDVNKDNIMDPRVNLRCGAYIALVNLRRDMVLGHGRRELARGMARYYGPMRDSQIHKRKRMARKTDAYCVARAKSIEPSQGVLAGL